MRAQEFVSEVNAPGELSVDPGLIKRFTDKGYQIDGEGRDQVVLSRPGSDYVLKIVGSGHVPRQQAVKRYVDFFRRNQQNPHFPRVGQGRELRWEGERYYIYTQERLYDFDGGDDGEIRDYLEYAMSELSHDQEPRYDRIPAGLTAEQVEGLVYAVDAMFQAGLGDAQSFDLGNTYNIMQRPNSRTLVIVDPFADWEEIDEAFDRPYRGKWEKSDYGRDLLVKLPDGSNLSIMFNLDHGAYGDEEWTVEFWRGNSQDVTGAGDQQRIFATVLNAIKKFIDREHPERIRFSANKDVDSGKSQSRSNLYNRLVQRYANSWGYDVDIDDFADTTVYNLHSMNEDVAENFADKKVSGKSRPGRVKRAGASCAGSVTDLRARAKKYGGEKGKMYHWCANMKSGRKKNK